MYRKLGEGTFSEVLKAESVKTKQKVAIKCMKSYFDNIEKVGCRITDMTGLKPEGDQGALETQSTSAYHPAD